MGHTGCTIKRNGADAGGMRFRKGDGPASTLISSSASGKLLIDHHKVMLVSGEAPEQATCEIDRRMRQRSTHGVCGVCGEAQRQDR